MIMKIAPITNRTATDPAINPPDPEGAFEPDASVVVVGALAVLPAVVDVEPDAAVRVSRGPGASGSGCPAGHGSIQRSTLPSE